MPVKKTLGKTSTADKKLSLNKRNAKSFLKNYFSKSFFTKKNLIIIGILFLVLVFWLLRKYYIVATVNGQPVSRFELNSRLNSQFSDSVLDQLINERLILGAARQEGIFITADEIESRVKKIEENLGGKMSLNEALSMQGLDTTTFRRQLELQLSIEKLFDKQTSVSSTDIEKYLENNKELSSEATDPAKLRSEVEGFIKQQKVSELYEEWFNKIRKDAKIEKNI
ncbi:hypothetical protein A3D05_05370 [Candidatus Gottesmanbacteria bacterium RIFCSPHIGHO2_02_FULL_40_24]|uniref:peptidylprolyl isomerase n=1 Tax=Candidatus Gottesmanbacteria bacterium RIFCSPHIGHO2_01_FULL_40_15 TaxID=1798376 RepID=A0A1F5Z6R3_9BACT|nr:MAG: hypothetical protein A2777_02005 [Candidatus Gottesmanbacteria bacterium RIFCSPHIGHO2_01_FULL_40_15]OGG16460.1 MAG: hypothetical protein A3D05_05370 [Candidatus Gottesmanbacteria bacterium RIFCSPHIGHO2_02_FULL_40_24]OGG22741.1 MAG: hypothetical protein A3B48_03000 [Candidatus Gottesmanbacteria bacterium RIFCSPLOWO2_01_FULL_40_10]OGG25573.1 MAG: hypothetical protein A3E42_04520 [Candidatus Gottesmanbacteria bacterium RIFCSPHIGHO2_12_FULL_40_13]OGG32579.1 MAG: hypothetical protein A3I80_0